METLKKKFLRIVPLMSEDKASARKPFGDLISFKIEICALITAVIQTLEDDTD
jgi:hypothetical protein